MAQKPARTVQEQLGLLQDRGMLFRDLNQAELILKSISYYRLIGYWWDLQADQENHTFIPNTYFEDVLERYEFDRKLKIILFDAIERVEITLRTKMIYLLSLSYGANWDMERKYIDENYTTIPFPFKELEVPVFTNKLKWTLEHLVGYLNTWSAVKHFIKQNGYNPVDELETQLAKFWHNKGIKEVRFPLLLRMGHIIPTMI